jgi:hypothetical protein
VALALEHANEREAGAVVKAMETLHDWMTRRRVQ